VDVIVGFPAETEAHFENTYRFLKDLPVAYLHAFTYSERPNTAAVDKLERMGEPIPKQERSRRNRMLRVLSQKKQHAFYTAHLGEVRPVLWEGAEKDGVMHGYTDNYIRVQKPYDPLSEGVIEGVRLGEMADDGTVRTEDAAFVSLL
jgi:threonylcarbamoyladenosine tRNA methylthiotransferase MtaB